MHISKHIIISNVSLMTILRSFSNSEDYYGDYYGDYDEDSYDSNDSEETSNGWVRRYNLRKLQILMM